MMSPRLSALALLAATSLSIFAETHFAFPTANHFLLEEKGDEKFFVGTPGKPWTAGSFGCVRSSGYQFHEGADIRALERDRRNEPTDPVLCTADGWIVHASRKAGLSNYGKYVVVGHKIEGLEIYSLYAHLSSIDEQWEPGKWIPAGAQIGVMGRTSNTRQRISRDRAHLHFELTLLLNQDFPSYFKKKYPKSRNDHGIWNGQNLIGIDPAAVFRAQHNSPTTFTLRDFIRERSSLFRVRVYQTEFPWKNRYLPLVLRSAASETESIYGYEIAFDAGGLPFLLNPIRVKPENQKTEWELSEVNESLYRQSPCRKLIVKTGARWRLTAKGRQTLELLLFNTP